jgi:hypothetical protein
MAAFVFEEFQEGDFRGLKSEPVLTFIQESFRDGREWSFHDLKENVKAPVLESLSRALQERTRQASLEEARDCLRALRKVVFQNRLKELQTEIARSEKRGEKEKLLTLLYQKQDITKQILAL